MSNVEFAYLANSGHRSDGVKSKSVPGMDLQPERCAEFRRLLQPGKLEGAFARTVGQIEQFWLHVASTLRDV